LNLLQAAADARVRRLVVASSTMLYGPRPDNPNFLTESHPLRGHPDAHCVQNRVEVEKIVDRWSRRRPEVEVCVLRGCWVVGPNTQNHVTRYLTRSTVPVVLGYDPLIQLVHEEDWLNAFELAVGQGRRGVFNVVGAGVAPLSWLLREAECWPCPSR
jgi:UDP-glucose 4-epimerase